MVESFKKLCQTFGAGALGAAVSALVFILLCEAGVMASLDVGYKPGLYSTLGNGGINNRTVWFYESLFLGGMFALIFNVPWIKGSQLQRAGIVMLFPAAFKLLYVFPMSGYSLFGLGYGNFTFVFVFFFSFVWALVAVSFASRGD